MSIIHDYHGSRPRRHSTGDISRTSPHSVSKTQIDRKNDYYYVQDLCFPMPEFDQKGKVIGFQKDRFHAKTILDGEIVVDVSKDGTSVRKFLAFDALIVDGKNLMQRNLSTRLGVCSYQSVADKSTS
jgi:hypothetical protein